ncbi:MAG: signal recognition particle-docking protein FtsY, partial [Nitrosarchaeum sp.]|nr:signal recognition particle-docking protein FtsY [Nitrosarchaeum sp.]
PKTNSSVSDPFAGIADADIFNYSELYDIPPPENDDEAIQLSTKIRDWIKQGRPKSGESKITKKTKSGEFDEHLSKKEEINDEKHKQDKEEEKSKKKRGVFGFFKK